jgi:dTDP-4-amino-4,6-dideoxygalactose transaminase
VDWDRFRLQTDFFNHEKIIIIEDAAQSFGASYKGIPSGKMGDVSVLSFDPTKNLNNYGSGGMVLTDDDSIRENLLDMRDNGKHGDHHWIGTNSKMSEADCAQMLVKLKYFDGWQARRKEIAEYYISELHQYVDIIMPGPDVESCWHKFVIRLDPRNRLKERLSSRGIETKVHYTTTLPDLPVAMDYVDIVEFHQYREALAFTKECLSLPIYPEMTDNEVSKVVEVILDYLT